MSDIETRFHETWLGLVQPTEGLVVSVPVLTDALTMKRLAPEVQERLLDLSREDIVDEKTPRRVIVDLARFFADVLEHPAAHFDPEAKLPPDLSLYVPEGQQTLRPSYGLLADPQTRALRSVPADAAPAVIAAAPYVALVWDVSDRLPLDKPETATGPWDYPLAAKFERLLRHCQVPIGILTNRRVIRLVYAPHGESSGHIDFRVDHMAAIDGRPILDALVMLLGAFRFYAAGTDRTLPELLAASRKRQADVTNDLAEQVLDAIQILLRGFEVAAERDGSSMLREAVAREDDHVYGGLLTVLLRLVFVLYAEDWSLLPVQSPVWAQYYSVLGLFEQLQTDHGTHPDSMSRRFGAWSRLIALFRAIYLGLHHTVVKADGTVDADQSISMPPRRGHLFDPERYPFLEGWPDGGAAPIKDADARAAVRVPRVDDATIFAVLQKLVLYRPDGSDHGQRLSYRALDVEQLGSVYEGLMGYHVEALAHDAVALKVKNKRSAARAWVEVDTLLAQPSARRVAWLEDELGFDKASAKKVADAVKDTTAHDAAVSALLDIAAGKSKEKRVRFVAPPDRYVLQPGPERRRTSSHYTPRELSAPIVRRTLEPLLAVMGDAPSSERILNLKICDPAMGSGAFLVEACRFLGDEVVKAWTRQGDLPKGEEPTLAARRMVAQRCLYGVDKNAYAIDLAKLSLWLVTLAKDQPFTFVDHSLRHGDSLVGLDFDQIRAGHWKVGKQVETAELTLREALAEAIGIRQEILDLAKDPSPSAQRLKEQKLRDAEDALRHARLLADVVVGAFFAHEKDKDREKERVRRLDAFTKWKATGDPETGEQLQAWQRELRARTPAFHWMLEFPEVFYADRPDPLEHDQVNRAAYMDAFVGNPPFMGGRDISGTTGSQYLDWLLGTYSQSHGQADLSAYFFRRAYALIGTHGTIGLIATNTIGQVDTRSVGLLPIVADGRACLYDTVSDMQWPGDANVAVAVVHVAIGATCLHIASARRRNTRLESAPERLDPIPLTSNVGMMSKGSQPYGDGFLLDEQERLDLVTADPHSNEVVFRYLGGDDVNRRPAQDPSRWVIDFGDRSLEQAQGWSGAYERVRQLVYPERIRNNRASRAQKWWQHGERAESVYERLLHHPRCLVTCQVTKHIVFALVPTARVVFANTLYLAPLDRHSPLAILSSRIHTAWAFKFASSMRTDPRYSASACFETFPFPGSDPRAEIALVERVGERFNDARAMYMLDEQVGLTITYNRLKDPLVTDERIVALRRLHEEMDAAVLAAYGWSDIRVPPFCIATEADQKALDAFENEVIDRLFALNAKRAEEERLLSAKAAPPRAPKKPRSMRAKKPDDDPQGSLL